jgi:hypothetical protein
MIHPCIRGNDQHFLSSGTLRPFKLSEDELEDLLLLDTVPLRINSKLVWSDTLDINDL